MLEYCESKPLTLFLGSTPIGRSAFILATNVIIMHLANIINVSITWSIMVGSEIKVDIRGIKDQLS